MAILTPNLKKGMGHVPRPYAPGTPGIRGLLGAVRAIDIKPVDWSAYVDHIRDQAQTSRCVGAARARVTHIRAQIQQFGRPNPTAVPYPSERGIYTGAREIVRESASDPLVDEGSSPSAADEFMSAESVGIPLEKDWPEDDAEINEPLTAEALAHATAIKQLQHYVLTSAGGQRVDDVCNVLCKYGPLSIAIPVGPEYERASGDTSKKPVMPASSVYGGHCIALVGWRFVPGSQSRREFLNPGSWGTTFGQGGYVWLDESVLADPRATDFVVSELVTNWAYGPDVEKRIAAANNGA